MGQKTILGLNKNSGQKKMLGPKNILGLRKILDPKNFFGPIKMLVPKRNGFEKNLSKKKFWSKQIKDPKNIWSTNKKLGLSL